ncbi:hypothetical protein [Dactylosporangium sp. NPDC005555]|uniref:hypothetical protein n=1 Tax=Dactylosporangium sp. NPDC005555 TaxID=3154889 RepID=UPI0033B7A1C7
MRTRPASPADVGALRFALLDTLTSLTGDAVEADTPAAAHLPAAALLHPATPTPGSDRVDDLVALATAVVHGADGHDPATTGVDHFVLAVALLLRHRLDDGGWDTDLTDLPSAVAHLHAAMAALPPRHPAAKTIIEALPAFLDPGRPS